MPVKKTDRRAQAVARYGQKTLKRKLNRVGRMLDRKVVRKLSIGQPVKRSAGSGLIYGTTPATPGAPPRVLTGFLRQSQTYRVEISLAQKFARLYLVNSADYAEDLERARKKKRRHPFIRPTIRENKKEILAEMRKRVR